MHDRNDACADHAWIKGLGYSLVRMSKVHAYPRYHRRHRSDEIAIGGVVKCRLECTEVRSPQLLLVLIVTYDCFADMMDKLGVGIVSDAQPDPILTARASQRLGRAIGETDGAYTAFVNARARWTGDPFQGRSRSNSIAPPAWPTAAPGTSVRPAARTRPSGRPLAPRNPQRPARPGCRHSRWS
jgi:hypothetical protein